MTEWRGPGRPFSVLFDGDDGGAASQDGGEARHALPAEVRELYGEWRLPAFPDRPYVYANFVVSHDGRVSFGMPGAVGGGTVSGFNRHDQWLMGLLRARADAILVGDNTLRSEPEHLWTAEAIFPDDAAAFAALRRAEGRRALPLQVFVSFDGNIAPEARVFGLPDLRIVIATTRAGVGRARAALGRYPNVDYLAMGEGAVDLRALTRALHRDYGAATVLCEGGPTLYGSLVRAGQLDDEFLTISPILIGNPRDGAPRPGLVEGVAFEPHAAPTSRLIGVRRASDHLFLRSRYRLELE